MSRSRSFVQWLIAIAVGLGLGGVVFGFPSWIGVYGSYSRHDGRNPGTFTVLMNQDYPGLKAEVGIKIGTGSWRMLPMTRTGSVSINSIWSCTPSTPFPLDTPIEYFFVGSDATGARIWDNRNTANYALFFPGPKPLQWAGNVSHWPPTGQIKPTDDVWVNVETWPVGAAVSVEVTYTTNGWQSAHAVAMNRAGQRGNNDWWNANLRSFFGGSSIEYFMKVRDGRGTNTWVNDSARNYRATVNRGLAAGWVGNQSAWPPDGSVRADTDFWLNVESWPLGAGRFATARYSVNGFVWYDEPMVRAGQRGNNDWWHLNLGAFPPGATIYYQTEVTDQNGARLTAAQAMTGTRVTASPTDTDQDGLPDDWELFWWSNLSASAVDNPDLDGLPGIPFENQLEWSTGTEPTISNETATLALIHRPAIPWSGGALRLSYNASVHGRMTNPALARLTTDGVRTTLVAFAHQPDRMRHEATLLAPVATQLVVDVLGERNEIDNNRGLSWRIAIRSPAGGQSPDTDQDTLTDAWELRHGLDPFSSSGLHGAQGDPDQDGIPNHEEQSMGTDPQRKNFRRSHASVSLAGSFNQWVVAASNMQLVSDFLWQADIAFSNTTEATFKFAADNSWAVNWGDANPTNTLRPLYGIVEAGSANITMRSRPVLHGTYRFQFNDQSKVYSVMRLDNEDSDRDGLPDEWEMGFLGTLQHTRTSDQDADGLDNAREWTLGTHPAKADTDGDGLSDGFEMNLLQTDPLRVDTDGDSVSDGREVEVGLDAKKSRTYTVADDATLAPSMQTLATGFTDHDRDGMPDSWEALHGLNTNLFVDRFHDADGDGIANGFEYENGTDPHRTDTDSDGMNDGFELQMGLSAKGEDVRGYPHITWEGTLDPDRDGITTIDEYTQGTNPRLMDTDGDRYPDDFELAWGSDPRIKTNYPGMAIPHVRSESASVFVRDDLNFAETSTETYSLTRAIERAIGSGQTHPIIKVYPGTYYGSIRREDVVRIPTNKKLLIIAMEGPQQTAIVGSDDLFAVEMTHNVTLDGFTIRHDPTTRGGGVKTIRESAQQSSAVINRCVITDHSADGIAVYAPTIVANTLITRNAGPGIAHYRPYPQEIFHLGIYNCSLVDNHYAGSPARVDVSFANVDIVNSIIRNNEQFPAATEGLIASQTVFSVSDSLVQLSTNLHPNPQGTGKFYELDARLNSCGYATQATPPANTNAWPRLGVLPWDQTDLFLESRPWYFGVPYAPAYGADHNGPGNRFDHPCLSYQGDDFDGDGLSDAEEQTLGSNPLDWDTDRDGLQDDDEALVWFTDPARADMDNDGLSDWDEVIRYHTRPDLADTDGDGISDTHEIQLLGTNPRLADTDGDGVSDAQQDSDGDGLSNIDELLIHKTNPIRTDSDGDRLSDWVEITLTLTNPLKTDSDNDGISDDDEDPDADGLINLLEVIGLGMPKTNPLVTDSDGDGLSDGLEVDVLQTNPLAADSDANGILDADEDYDGDGLTTADEMGVYGTDPQRFDTDGDGLDDGVEVLITLTDPLSADSDGNGVTDDQEDLDGDGWSTREELIYTGTHPRLADTDGDGLRDSEEEDSDPRDPDTDDDGVSDGFEVNTLNTNPRTADTDGNGVPDGEEDPDQDGLTNHDEEQARTNPIDADSDADGLSDAEEVSQTLTDPNRADSDGDGLADPLDDQDADLLGNLVELDLTLTSPTNPDSDHDGVLDSAEDPDADGLTNLDEVTATFTDPHRFDTDSDGLSDADEHIRYRTNPNHPDTDGDGLTDADELRITLTDPLRADSDGNGVNDGDEDPDGDGLTNREETRLTGTNPHQYDTNGDGQSDAHDDQDDDGLTNEQEARSSNSDPRKADTDGDGLTDGQEWLVHHTRPDTDDTDGDGLRDGDEINASGLLDTDGISTDPITADTDGDGYSDGDEAASGMNALQSADGHSKLSAARTWAVGYARALGVPVPEFNHPPGSPADLAALDQLMSQLEQRMVEVKP
ncbi:MAG TPA: hypothetical protein PKC67_06780 [Kiritimatiellia bacterium]|nr:hypothetical protein [Kiritimatiellia bacterium]HMP34041.1 hypothetical protein [Kiritimatiellia bacterium]